MRPLSPAGVYHVQKCSSEHSPLASYKLPSLQYFHPTAHSPKPPTFAWFFVTSSGLWAELFYKKICFNRWPDDRWESLTDPLLDQLLGSRRRLPLPPHRSGINMHIFKHLHKTRMVAVPLHDGNLGVLGRRGWSLYLIHNDLDWKPLLHIGEKRDKCEVSHIPGECPNHWKREGISPSLPPGHWYQFETFTSAHSLIFH